MILDGVTGGRCTASAALARRPSPVTRSSPSRRTSTAAPASRILRYSGIFIPPALFAPALSAPALLALACPAIRPPSRPATCGPVKPYVHLAGADGVLVVAERAAWRGHRAPAQPRDHHQVVRELGLRPHPGELRHRVDHLGVVAGLEPGDPLGVRRPRLGCPDVRRVAGLVRAQLAQRPER